MDDKNSNQYKNVCDETGCMKCRDQIGDKNSYLW